VDSFHERSEGGPRCRVSRFKCRGLRVLPRRQVDRLLGGE
jgi:hypothetical protein